MHWSLASQHHHIWHTRPSRRRMYTGQCQSGGSPYGSVGMSPALVGCSGHQYSAWYDAAAFRGWAGTTRGAGAEALSRSTEARWLAWFAQVSCPSPFNEELDSSSYWSGKVSYSSCSVRCCACRSLDIPKNYLLSQMLDLLMRESSNLILQGVELQPRPWWFPTLRQLGSARQGEHYWPLMPLARTTTYSQFFLPNVTLWTHQRATKDDLKHEPIPQATRLFPVIVPSCEHDARLPFSQPEVLVGITPTRRPWMGLPLGSHTSVLDGKCVRVFFLGTKPNRIFDIVYCVELNLSVAT